MMDHYGVEPIGGHIDLGALTNDPQTVLDECLALGLPCVGIGPSFYGDRERKPDQISKNEQIAKAARLLKENGIKLVVHCAAYGWLRDCKGRLTSEGMIEDAGGLDFLEPELDLAWLVCAGLDPAEFMTKFKNHMKIVHFRDFRKLPEWSEYILVRHNTICDHGYGCAVGEGVLDLKKLVPRAAENGAEWAVTELWNEPGSAENAKISAENIKKYM
jgi:sugar phosphate isomerase/epimerase